MKHIHGYYTFIAVAIVLIVIHFHSSEIFTRPLIDYDDVQFIAPLKEMTLSTYFKDWLPQRENFAFPLRDLTFFADFAIEPLLSFKTLWITNFVIFVLILWSVFLIYQTYLKSTPILASALFAIIALHPLNVEIVQWTSNRKHLMVALCLSVATTTVFRLLKEKRKPEAQHWLLFILSYVAAWFCWPSTVLWIFWVLFVFRKNLREDANSLIWVLSSVSIAIGALLWTYSSHDSYSSAGSSAESLSNLGRTVLYLTQSLGRGLFNFFFPYQLAPYYKLHHWMNHTGLVILFALSIFIYKKMKMMTRETREDCQNFFLLSAALFFPQALIFGTYHEFVWADRYTFLGLPYFAMGLTLTSLGAQKKESKNKTQITTKPPKILLAYLVLILFAFIVRAYTNVPKWQSTRHLFESCAYAEQSPKCLALGIEKNFDKTGCLNLSPLFTISEKVSKQDPWPYDFMFRIQVPFYQSLCLAQNESSTTSEKLLAINNLRNTYNTPFFTIFGEILVHLQNQNLSTAMQRAQENYFSPFLKIPEADNKMINLIRGQSEALCIISQNANNCLAQLKNLMEITKGVPVNPAQHSWARNQTLMSINAVQKVHF